MKTLVALAALGISIVTLGNPPGKQLTITEPERVQIEAVVRAFTNDRITSIERLSTYEARVRTDASLGDKTLAHQEFSLSQVDGIWRIRKGGAMPQAPTEQAKKAATGITFHAVPTKQDEDAWEAVMQLLVRQTKPYWSTDVIFISVGELQGRGLNGPWSHQDPSERLMALLKKIDPDLKRVSESTEPRGGNVIEKTSGKSGRILMAEPIAWDSTNSGTLWAGTYVHVSGETLEEFRVTGSGDYWKVMFTGHMSAR